MDTRCSPLLRKGKLYDMRAGTKLALYGKDSDIQEIIDAVEGRRLPCLTEEKPDESVIRLIAAALLTACPCQ